MQRPVPIFFVLLIAIGCDFENDDTAQGDADADTDTDADSDTDSDADADTDTDTDTDADADTDADSDADTDVEALPAYFIEGDVTWSLDFDSEAEGLGWQDCAYSRSYEGTRIADQPYLCPECTVMFKGTAEMYEGYKDCSSPLFGGEQTHTELWGLSWIEGGKSSFFRTYSENGVLGELTSIKGIEQDVPFEMTWEAEYSLTDGGAFSMVALGEVTLSLDEQTELENPLQPRSEPYACGWPLNNPGDLETDWVLAMDAVFPTAWLEDECGEIVDLWDFYGSYLVIDSTQNDCGYCLWMAEESPAFLKEMAVKGVDVRFISLLGDGLSNVTGEPDQSTYDAFLAAYGSGEPILKDRGFGYAMFYPYLEGEIGWPVWAIVRPDMTVMAVETGFSSWDEFRDLILEDMGG